MKTEKLNNLMTNQQPTQFNHLINQTNLDDRTEQFVWTIAQAADERQASDIVILNVKDISYLSDYFVIATGFSKTQVRAIADAIEKKLHKNFRSSR